MPERGRRLLWRVVPPLAVLIVVVALLSLLVWTGVVGGNVQRERPGIPVTTPATIVVPPGP